MVARDRVLSAAWCLALACRGPVPSPIANQSADHVPTRDLAEPTLDWEPPLAPEGVVETPVALSRCVDDDCQVVASFSIGEQIAMAQRSPSGSFVAVVHRPRNLPWTLTAFAASGRGPSWSSRIDGFDGPSSKTYRWLADDGLLIAWSAGTGIENCVALRGGQVVVDRSATEHAVSADGEFIAVLTAGTPATAIEVLDARTGGVVTATTVAGYPRLSWGRHELTIATVSARTTVRLPR